MKRPKPLPRVFETCIVSKNQYNHDMNIYYNQYLKKGVCIAALLSLFFVGALLSVHTVYSAERASLSGDVCGGIGKKKCELTDIPKIVKNVVRFVIGYGFLILIVFVTVRFVMAWFALQQGNANAYKEALSKSTNAFLGFLFIVMLSGGLLFTVLKYFGIKDELLDIGIFQSFFFDIFATHAYAAEGQYLPNFFPSDDINDFLTAIIRVVMRFFVYPALLCIWVWTGFAFIAAQGAPDALSKAKKWFMWATVTTLVIFTVQMFLIAIQGTIEKILPGTVTYITTPKEETGW